MSKIINNIDEIVEFYKREPITLAEMKKIFNICCPVLSKILKDNQCNIYTKQDLNNKGTLINYFENIDSEEKAYILGLILTDGCIFKQDNGALMLSITFKHEDKYMIENIKSLIKINRKIVVDNRDLSTSISITSDKLCNDLIKLGVNIGKDKRILPILKQELMPHLIRGIIDGDGYIGFRKIKNNNIRWTIKIAGNKQFITELRNYMVNAVNITNNSVNKEDNIFAITWGAKDDVNKILNYIYKDTNLCLDRKKQKYIKFLNWYV